MHNVESRNVKSSLITVYFVGFWGGKCLLVEVFMDFGLFPEDQTCKDKIFKMKRTKQKYIEIKYVPGGIHAMNAALYFRRMKAA